MDRAVQHRFAPTAFFIWSGLLVWAADFLLVYVFAALACARGFAHLQIAGFSIVPFVTTLVSIVALLATAALMWPALRRARNGPSSDQHSQFILFLAIALSALALIAIVWTGLPPLLLRVGCT